MKKSEVTDLLHYIKGHYGAFTVDDGSVQAWADFLEDNTFQEAREAVRRFVRDNPNGYPPRPAVIAEMLRPHRASPIDPAFIRTYYKAQARRGLVWCRHNVKGKSAYDWQRVENCHRRLNGSFCLRIDFVMDIFGPDVVTEELRNIGISPTNWSAVANPESGLAKAYRAKLDELYQIACDREKGSLSSDFESQRNL